MYSDREYELNKNIIEKMIRGGITLYREPKSH